MYKCLLKVISLNKNTLLNRLAVPVVLSTTIRLVFLIKENRFIKIYFLMWLAIKR